MRQVYSDMTTYSSQPPTSLPPGLLELMEGLTRAVLQKNPADIYSFCAEHFDKLLDIRDLKEGKRTEPRKMTLEQKIKRAQDFMRAKAEDRQRFLENKAVIENDSNVTENELASNGYKSEPQKEIENVEGTVNVEEISNNLAISLPSPHMSPQNEIEPEPIENKDPSMESLEVKAMDEARLEAVLSESSVTNTKNAVQTDENVNTGIMETISKEVKKEYETDISQSKVFENTAEQEQIKENDTFKGDNKNNNEILNGSYSVLTETANTDEVKEADTTIGEQLDLETEDSVDATTNIVEKEEYLLEMHNKASSKENDCKSTQHCNVENFKSANSEEIKNLVNMPKVSMVIAAEEIVDTNDKTSVTEQSNLENEDIANVIENVGEIVENTPKVNRDLTVNSETEKSDESMTENVLKEKVQKVESQSEKVSGEVIDMSEEVIVEESILGTHNGSSQSSKKEILTIVSQNNDNTDINNAKGAEDVVGAIEMATKQSETQIDIALHEHKTSPDIIDSKILLHNAELEILSSVKEDIVFKHDSVEVENDVHVTNNDSFGNHNNEASRSATTSSHTKELDRQTDFKSSVQENNKTETEIDEESTTEEYNKNTEKGKLTDWPESLDLETAAITIQKVFKDFMFKSTTSISEDNKNDVNSMESESEAIYDEKSKSEASLLKKSIGEAPADDEKAIVTLIRMNTILQTVNEEKSLSLSTEESQSSAATIIQAHVRGYLIRNKLKLTSSETAANSDEKDIVYGENENIQTKTVLDINIHEQGNLVNADESIDVSVDLPTDDVNYVANLHPLGYDRNEARKRLKREDAIQSVSPPSNSSIKLSEEENLKEEILTQTEGNLSTGIENIDSKEDTEKVEEEEHIENDIANEQSKESQSGKCIENSAIGYSLFEENNTVNIQPKEVMQKSKNEESATKELFTEEFKITEYEITTDENILKRQTNLDDIDEPPKNKGDSLDGEKILTKMCSDEMDVVTGDKPGLLHSSEFHDVMLPTKVVRKDTSVVREFKSVLVYFLMWHSS